MPPTPTIATTPTLALANVADTFTFDHLAESLLVAAAFGLTPGLLLSRLNQQAKQYASDISSSQTTNSK